MKREELIKKIYLELIGEENYNLIKNQINENVVCKIMDEYHNFITPKTTLMDLGFKRDDEKITSWLDSDGGYFVPKSLQVIENNNGWIKIESEEDLPKIGTYDMSTSKLIYWTNGGQYEANDYKKWVLHYPHLEITHYQFIPIIKLNEPLY